MLRATPYFGASRETLNMIVNWGTIYMPEISIG